MDGALLRDDIALTNDRNGLFDVHMWSAIKVGRAGVIHQNTTGR